MNTKIALLGLGGIGVAGYLLYNYLSNTSTSTTSVGGSTGSQLPIGQATPYETTGHLEDPLITQLLNSLQNAISNLQAPIGTTTTTVPVISKPAPGPIPPIVGVISGNTSSYPTTSSGSGVNGGPYNGQGNGNWNFGGGYHLPFIAPPAKTSTTTTTTTTTPTSSGSTSVVSNYNTGLFANTQNASQIQTYNPYYKTPTQAQASGQTTVSATSTVGNIITGAAVNTIQNVVKDLGGSQSQATTASNAYLNTTRPVVTTLESYAHPVIAAANTAISDLSGAVSSVASDVSTASKVVNSVENNVASSIGNFFKGW